MPSERELKSGSEYEAAFLRALESSEAIGYASDGVHATLAPYKHHDPTLMFDAGILFSDKRRDGERCKWRPDGDGNHIAECNGEAYLLDFQTRCPNCGPICCACHKRIKEVTP